MKELPKELTAELLGLVMNFIPDSIEINKDKESLDLYELNPEDGSVVGGGNMNLDTLTRHMKEWVCKDFGDCIGSIDCYTHYEGVILKVSLIYDMDKNSEKFKADSEFEAVLKATHWVAKEKGLLCS